MASVNWPTILVGSVLTAALTLLGQLLIQRRQHRLTQEMTEWNARRERADRIEQAASRVFVGLVFMLREYNLKVDKPHNIEMPLSELKQALEEVGNLPAHRQLTHMLINFWADVSDILVAMKANKPVDTMSEVWENCYGNYVDLVEALKHYRSGRV